MIKVGDTIIKRINTGTSSAPNYDAIRFAKGPDGKMIFASVNQTTLEWRNLHLLEDEGMAYPYSVRTSADGDTVPCSAAQIEITKIPTGLAGGGTAKSADLKLRMIFGKILPSSISKFNVGSSEYQADYFYVRAYHTETDNNTTYYFNVDVGRGNSSFDKEMTDDTYECISVVGPPKFKVSLYLIRNPASDKYGQEYTMVCVVELKQAADNDYQVVWKYLYENAIFTPEHFTRTVVGNNNTVTYQCPEIKLSVAGDSRFEYNLCLGGDLVSYRNLAQIRDLNETALSPDYTYDYGLSNIQLTT